MENQITVGEILKKELLEQGLNIGEDTAVAVFKAVMSAARKVAAVTPNKLDDFGVEVVSKGEPYVLALLDKIDGQVG